MRTHWLRTAAALIALPLLTVGIVYQLYRMGTLDSFAKERVRQITEDNLLKTSGNRWYGVELWQFPDDMMIYQEIVTETKPDVIIETGTHHGGLTLYLATLLGAVNPDGRIITVDIDIQKLKKTLEGLDLKGKEALKERIIPIEGSSFAPNVVEQVAKHIKPGSRVLVILDADHSKDAVLKELQAYARFVKPGEYLIVNDTYLDTYVHGEIQAGASAAVREFLAADPNFAVDSSRDKFVVSCAPGGFLKRVK